MSSVFTSLKDGLQKAGVTNDPKANALMQNMDSIVQSVQSINVADGNKVLANHLAGALTGLIQNLGHKPEDKEA